MKIRKFNESKADDEFDEFQKLPYEISDQAEYEKKKLIKKPVEDEDEQAETKTKLNVSQSQKILNEIGEKIDADENWANTDKALKLAIKYVKSWEK